MPRYYLRAEPNGESDPDGEELSGPQAARSFCDALARELRGAQGCQSLQTLVIRDEQGIVVHESPLVLH